MTKTYPAGHFLDSGSFTLQTEAKKWAAKHGKDAAAYYDTPGFWDYMKCYAEFVTEHAVCIDHYANVDVIGDPDLTWRNQEWLEEQGLEPVPVVHYRTDKEKWLRHYLDNGYDYIGLGGLVGSTRFDTCLDWIDGCFHIICDNKDKLPSVRVHGFGVTSFKLLLRYPWYSVDSTSWTKAGAFGNLYVPLQRDGDFCLTEPPYVIMCSTEESKRNPKKYKPGEGSKHYLSLTADEKEHVQRWLKEIDVPLGVITKDGEVLEDGVISNHTERRVANLLYFERMRDALPEYPFPFTVPLKQNFGLI